MNRQAPEHTVVAKEVAKRKVLILTRRRVTLRASHNQILFNRNDEIGDLKVLLGSAQTSANGQKYDKDRAKTRVQKLQSDH